MSAPQTAHTSPPKPKQHVKFNLPPALQTFTCFPRLPIEIQDAIWEAAVDEPGVHWLKLEHPSWDFWGLHGLFAPHMVAQINNDAVDTDDEEIDPIQRECQLEPRPSLTKAILTHPENQRADKSWHLYVQKQMATMFATNSLAQRSAMRMMRNADIKRFTLTKDGVRRFTMLNASCDLAFLEYLPPHLYQSDCGLSVRFETEHLSTIRNVAVRYHPDWHVENDTAKCCPRCGRYHRVTRAITPKHLYHFLARSFPNLETVWLVDYMMIARKKEVRAVEKCRCGRHVGPRMSKHSALCKPQQGNADAKMSAQGAKLHSYRATDRTFYEATPESWLVKDRVLRIKDWLQDSYVRYSKMSKYACHKAPETVKFGILGCKYHDPELAPGDSLGKVARKAKRQADRDPVVTRKSRRKLSLGSDQGIFTFYFDRPFAGDQLHTLPTHYFGSGTLTGFDFEFEMGNLSLDDQHRASVGVLGKDRHLA